MLGVPLDEFAKNPGNAQVTAYDVEADRDLQQVDRPRYDPKHDKRDMYRLGKTQELRRRFRFFSIVGYIVILGLTWEYSLTTEIFSLSNGGPAGAVWIFFATCVGMFFVMLSMAEMASMAPTSGGQYHWVSEFGDPRYQKPLSYAVGWLSALGWQTAMPGTAYIGAQQVLALISICNPEYAIQGWHGTLLTIAFVTFAILFNTFAIGKLPLLEGLAVILHVFGFLAFVVILWVMAPHDTASNVFTGFQDNNGWGSKGVATIVGIVGPAATLLGADSAVHLAEELKDAAYVLPRAMFCAALINYALGFTITVTFIFALGDIEADINSPTGQPWVAVIQRATNSFAATAILLVVLIIMFVFCAINQVTTSSRQVWAFARDKGLPFHRFLSRVRESDGVPKNSVYLTLTVTSLLSLIIIGSSAAFNIILTLCSTGLFASYLLVISTLISKRLRKEEFPPSRFNLGWLGMPVNIIAVCFLIVAFVFLFFPAAPHPDPASMNWAILINGVVLLIAFAYYFVRARHEYEGPVTYIRKDLNMAL